MALLFSCGLPFLYFCGDSPWYYYAGTRMCKILQQSQAGTWRSNKAYLSVFTFCSWKGFHSITRPNHWSWVIGWCWLGRVLATSLISWPPLRPFLYGLRHYVCRVSYSMGNLHEKTGCTVNNWSRIYCIIFSNPRTDCNHEPPGITQRTRFCHSLRHS